MQSNFTFLERKWPELSKLVKTAEKNLYTDSNTTMIKLRMFTEQVVDYMFAYDNLEEPEENSLHNKLKLLEREGLLNDKTSNIFHTLRIEGNRAVHESNNSLEDAKRLLSLSYKLAVWFMQVYGEWDFEPEEFIMPKKGDVFEGKRDMSGFRQEFKEIINNMQEEIAAIKSKQNMSTNIKERKEMSQKSSKQIIFDAEENEMLKIVDEDQQQESATTIDSSYKFITTDINELDQDSVQRSVWDSVKRSFSGRQCIAYWKYPLFSKRGEKKEEPEIIIADKEQGVILLEIWELEIEDIKQASYEEWTLKNGAQITPQYDAEEKLLALKGLYQPERSLLGIYEKIAVILPKIHRSEWEEKGFNDKNIIFGNELGKKTFFSRISELPLFYGNSEISDKGWDDLLMVLTGQVTFREETNKSQEKSGIKSGITNFLGNFRKQSQKRSEVKSSIKNDLYKVDMQQEVIGKTIPPGPQRIRGIAGSGKTVLLAQKAAHMHLKHPEWKIALIFFTRSLYDSVMREVDKWLRRFSNGEMGYDPIENDKLEILHAWGAKDQEGFYRKVSKIHGVKPLNAGRKKLKKVESPNEKLIYACKLLLEQVEEIEKIYDAILIDEAQDLIVDNDEIMYEDKQPFYWLAYKTLKPLANGEKRLIWAYDEAQSLNSLNIPTAPQLFGEEPDFKRMVSGFHEGGIRKSEIMNKCYRTPGPVLTAAHAIGMGLLRPEGMLRGFTTKEDWENIGYEVVEGSFNPVGQKVKLHRPQEMTPNRVPKLWEGEIIKFNKYNTRKEELNEVADKIQYNLETDELNPSRDILVIVLGTAREAFKLKIEAAKTLKRKGIDVYIPKALKNNVLYPKFPNIDPDKFWNKGGVTVSNTYRAKGNEAYMVYVVGLDKIAESEDDISLRNQLFVAMTRTKGWLHVSGVGDFKMYDEFSEVLKSGNTFEFTFQRPLAEKKLKEDNTKERKIKVNDVIELKNGKRGKVVTRNKKQLEVKITKDQTRVVKPDRCTFIREGKQTY